MKASRLLPLLLWLLPSLLLISPPSIMAQDCSQLSGHCIILPCDNGQLGGFGQLNCPITAHCCANANSQGARLCNSGTGTNNGINTAIGCIPLDRKGFINTLLSWAFGLAGGIAFILILIAGLQLATSTGDPKRVKAAQELLTSALEGLVLIVLAVVILNFIGVSVLGLSINQIGFSISL